MSGFKRVLEWGMNRRAYVHVEEKATRGGTIGDNIFNADGSLFSPEETVTEIVNQINSDAPAASKYLALWRFILEIPQNIQSLAAMTGIGFATRISAASEWANRTITGVFGRITVESGDGVAGNQKLMLNNGDYVTLNSGEYVELNEPTDGNPVINLGAWPTVQNSIADGLEYIIGYGTQLIVFESFDVSGTLNVKGDLVIL